MWSPTDRLAGISAILGGVLWAVTPLRQPVFGAGRTPEEGELFFRAYNGLIVVVVVLLTAALLRHRAPSGSGSRVRAVGWCTILVGHLMLLLGSLPALLLGGTARSLVMGAQDLGFLGALVAGLGALVLGAADLRRRAGPVLAAWLFVLTVPLGLLATVLLSVAGVPEDYLGLPLTVLYGGAWVVLGLQLSGRRAGRRDGAAPNGASA